MSNNVIVKKNSVAYLQAERDIMTKINHPFLVSLRYAFQTASSVYLVMPFVAGGELFHHLSKQGLLLEVFITKLIYFVSVLRLVSRTLRSFTRRKSFSRWSICILRGLFTGFSSFPRIKLTSDFDLLQRFEARKRFGGRWRAHPIDWFWTGERNG